MEAERRNRTQKKVTDRVQGPPKNLLMGIKIKSFVWQSHCGLPAVIAGLECSRILDLFTSVNYLLTLGIPMEVYAGLDV